MYVLLSMLFVYKDLGKYIAQISVYAKVYVQKNYHVSFYLNPKRFKVFNFIHVKPVIFELYIIPDVGGGDAF